MHLLWPGGYTTPALALGTPQAAGVVWLPTHSWATFDYVPRSEALGTPKAAGTLQPTVAT